MAPGKTFGSPNGTIWSFGSIGLDLIWGMAQLAVIKVLRVHIHVRNIFRGSSMDKATVPAVLDHQTHQ